MKNEHIYPLKDFSMNVQRNIIHNSKKPEMIKMSNKQWKSKQNMVYQYNETSFGNKKKWNTDMCHATDEPQKHYAESKKPDAKNYI